jgi:hypothetical protein
MSQKIALPQKQEPYTVHYKTVLDFLQTVQEAGVHIVHLEALQRRIHASEVWGVLLTVRLGDEIQVAWVVASHAMNPGARQRAHAVATQARIQAQVQALVTQHGLTARPGFYAVPEAFAFQYAAALPEEEDGPAAEEGDQA